MCNCDQGRLGLESSENTLWSKDFRKLPILTRFSNHILVSATWMGDRGQGTDFVQTTWAGDRGRPNWTKWYSKLFFWGGVFFVLKQTCKFLLAVTNHRTIWLNAVQRVLEDHLIPPILFPLDAMNQSALQHVALLPGRFSWLLKQPMEDDLYPISIRVLSVCFSQKQIARCNLSV